jgi:SNF2 family DNA or RNA helicase
MSERQSIIDNFEKIEGSGVLVLNPRAAGTGLNITAANHVVHYNLEWNPAVEDQASARAYRRGQTRPVTVHRLFYIDTMEEIINRRIELKRMLFDSAVIGHTGENVEYNDIINAINMSPKKGGS